MPIRGLTREDTAQKASEHVSKGVHTASNSLRYVVDQGMTMESLIHWFAIDGNAISVLVTMGIAVLLACCLECSNCPSRDKDDLFRHHAL